jgi:hypothetical protein
VTQLSVASSFASPLLVLVVVLGSARTEGEAFDDDDEEENEDEDEEDDDCRSPIRVSAAWSMFVIRATRP